MIIRDQSTRRAASLLARCGVVFSVVGLGISAWNMSLSGVPGAAAATDAGAAQVVHPADAGPEAGQPILSGGSATPFTIALPVGAACSKDSANGDYRVQSYMVPDTLSPNDLTFDSSGPSPQGYGGTLADFRMPLWDVTQGAYVDASTALAEPAGGPGPVVNIPAFAFGVYAAGDVPAGSYNVGIACTDADRVIEKFWNVRLTVTADGADQPSGFTWAVASGGGTTTTTTGATTTTTEVGTTTTTGGDGSTTTTTAGGTTTTTTDTDVSGGGYGGTPSAASAVTTAGQLPYTGSSPIPTVAWALALVVFGRMAMLLGKRPKVIGDDPTG